MNGKLVKRVGLVLMLSAGLCLAAGATEPPKAETQAAQASPAVSGYDRSFIVQLGGKSAGSMRTWQRIEGGHIVTDSEMDMAIKRGPIEVKVGMKGRFVETLDHKPVSMRSEQSMGSIPMVMDITFKEGSLDVVSTQGQQVTRSTQAFTDTDWLTPSQVDARTREEVRAFLAGKSVPETLRLRMIDPVNGPVVIESSRGKFEKATIEVDGKKIAVVKTITTTSVTPGIEQTEYLDADGLPLRTEAQMGGIPVTMTAATAADAAGAVANAGNLGPELMVSTFVKPDKTIRNPRGTNHGVYVLSVPEGAMPDLPTTAGQTSTRVDSATVKVEVIADKSVVADKADLTNPEFTASTAMLSCNDPAITALAAKALKDGPEDDPRKAEALRQFVHSYINSKGLSVGFASASETVQTRQGDCTEHGVLLAALLRAAGIPSRVASGLIYADSFAGSRQIFGYHMWAQALLMSDEGPKWVDFDATLPSAWRFDATHIALSTSSLKDGETYNSMVVLAPLLGRLKISVEKAE